MKCTSTIATLVALTFGFLASVQSAPVPLDARADVGGTSTLVERAMRSPRITFYSGSQLNNPACGGPTPSRNAMVAAVKDGGKFECGDTIRIKNKDRQIKVKVVDFCESCSDLAVDLTPGAFAKLASLDQGIITGAQMWVAK